MPEIVHSAYILVGATASGKTAVAQLLAERRCCAIVSADAMQVYRGMDVGTAKATPAERGNVPYFGLDLVDPGTPFSAGQWLRAVSPAFDGKLAPIVTGGTGLYVRALLQGLDAPAADPKARQRWQALFAREGVGGLQRALQELSPAALQNLADPQNPRRLMRALEKAETVAETEKATPQANGSMANKLRDGHRIAGLRMARPLLRARIRQRTIAMYGNGLAEEVASLRERYGALSATAATAIGYAEAAAWLDGRMSRAEALERTVVRTCQLAKRQETWFRHQLSVVWVDVAANDTAATLAARVEEVWHELGPTATIC